jgi:AcrR family transcriptional regulator
MTAGASHAAPAGFRLRSSARCSAVASLADQGGYGRTTIAKIVETAGISTKTFYELFEGKDECLLAAHRAYSGELGDALAESWASSDAWAERVRAALDATLAYGESAPAQLRFLLLDAPTAGRALQAERRRAAAPLVAALREGRAGPGAREQPPLTEEMLLAALAWRIGAALEDDEALVPLAPSLLEFTLAPFWAARPPVSGLAPERGVGMRPRSGRPGAPPGPQLVGEIQRGRILDALRALLSDGDLAELTLNRVIRRAGMSVRTFRAYFDDFDECLLALYRIYSGELEQDLRDAWMTAESWPEKVRTAIAAALAFGERSPLAARFLAVDALTWGGRLAAAHAESVDRLGAKLAEGRERNAAAAGLNPLTERFLIAGSLALVADRLSAEEGERLATLAPELAELVLAPYLDGERK